MHLGIFAKTFPRPTLDETLDTIAYHHLTHVQFNMSCAGLPTLPDRIDENLCRSIARSLRDRGLTMAAISGTFNLCDPDAGRLDDNLRRLDVLAGACRWLDTRIITLCTGTLDPEDMWKHHPDNVRRSTWDTLLQSMRKAVDIADRHEVTLAFEPEIHNVVSSVMRARRLLDEIDSPWLKVVIDPTNLFAPGEVRPFSELLSEAFDWLAEDIVLAHLKPPDIAVTPADQDWFSRFLPSFLGMPSRAPQEVSGELLVALLREGGRESLDLDRMTRLHLFVQTYVHALRSASYDGAVVIHGDRERSVGGVAVLLRHALDIAEIAGPGGQ